MSNFVNTVDVIGDEALTASIIDRSITEFKDDRITRVGYHALCYCNALKIVDIPSVTSFGSKAFYGCGGITALILRSETVVTLDYASAVQGTSITSGKGYVYIPRALVNRYKAATNWSACANQFRALEDYTVDGTITGELDPAKI